jgi:hypothetical protein
VTGASDLSSSGARFARFDIEEDLARKPSATRSPRTSASRASYWGAAALCLRPRMAKAITSVPAMSEPMPSQCTFDLRSASRSEPLL